MAKLMLKVCNLNVCVFYVVWFNCCVHVCIMFHSIEVFFSLSEIYFCIAYVYYIFKIVVFFLLDIVISVFVTQIYLNILYKYTAISIFVYDTHMATWVALLFRHSKGFVSNVIFGVHKKQAVTCKSSTWTLFTL